MWIIAASGILIASVIWGYTTQSGRNTREWIKTKRRKWKDLVLMVSTRHSGIMIYVISWKMLFQAAYADFLSLFDNRVKKLADKTYEINYYVEGKLYKYPVKVKRGPSSIFEIKDQDGNDMMLELNDYIEPNGKLHNPLVTPKFFGCSSITIETMTDSKTFVDDQIIEIS